MKKKIFFIILFSIILTPSLATFKEEIINNLKTTNNLSFKFKQTIDEKTEEGMCIIQYPKKIFCEYNNIDKKIMISDGKSLVIKKKLSNQYYRYPLKKTPLELLLDKDYLINQIKNLDGRSVDNQYFNFQLKNGENKINIFFDSKTLNLIGWQTEDVYQNLVITFISSIKRNQKIEKNIFILPKIN